MPMTLFRIYCLALLAIACPALGNDAHPLAMWQINGANNSVYLLGSIHMLREEDYPLPSAIYAAYEEAEILVMELDMDDLDPVAEQALATELGSIKDGRLLRDLMGPALYAEAEELAEALRLPLAILEKSEPWFAAINVEMMMLMRIGFNPMQGIEYHLSALASGDNKEILGLETTREQLEILDNLSSEAQREMLIQTLSDSLEIADAMDEMVNAWRYGDIQFLEVSLLKDMQEFEELYEAIVVQRNKKWAEEIRKFLNKDDDYLVIVGALHLVGEEGVPHLLSQQGLEVTQLNQAKD